MKKVGVLFVVFLALAAFVYFYEIVGEGEERKPAAWKKASFVPGRRRLPLWKSCAPSKRESY